MPDEKLEFHPSIMNLLRFFRFDHLPANLQEVSRAFAELAHDCARRSPNDPETSTALRKLLEAKDAAVRAALEA